jgi:hypothetical protein
VPVTAAGLFLAILLSFASVAGAETLRLATFNADLSRAAPGLLLRDLTRGDADAERVAAIVKAVRPDILLITKFDHDPRGRALKVFRDLLRAGKDGIDYPHLFAGPVNAGVPSGHDLDRDGKLMGWNDGFGFGRFPGEGGMAILSRHRIDEAGIRTFREFLWRDLPDHLMPVHPDNTPWPTAEAQAVMRLSSRAHWDVPVILPDGRRLHLLASYPSPPIFGDEAGTNLRRNHDEIVFWVQYLYGVPFTDDQGRSAAAPDAPLAVMGSLNADPADGDGMRIAIQRLVGHDRLQDPLPASAGAVAAAREQGGANAAHLGDPALDTVDWRDDTGPGNLRVDYVLPGAGLTVEDAGVFWPAPDAPGAELVAEGSSHRLVWVDIRLPRVTVATGP